MIIVIIVRKLTLSEGYRKLLTALPRQAFLLRFGKEYDLHYISIRLRGIRRDLPFATTS